MRLFLAFFLLIFAAPLLAQAGNQAVSSNISLTEKNADFVVTAEISFLTERGPKNSLRVHDYPPETGWMYGWNEYQIVVLVDDEAYRRPTFSGLGLHFALGSCYYTGYRYRGDRGSARNLLFTKRRLEAAPHRKVKLRNGRLAMQFEIAFYMPSAPGSYGVSRIYYGAYLRPFVEFVEGNRVSREWESIPEDHWFLSRDTFNKLDELVDSYFDDGCGQGFSVATPG